MCNTLAPNFVKIVHKDKAALVDPESKVCLGVSREVANHIDHPAIQAKIMPIWEQQASLQKKNTASTPIY